MTHITEARVIGSHAEMGGPSQGNSHGPLTVFDVLRAGVRHRVRRAETDAAQSTWDSEGGATEEGAPLSR
jgi:hypothetical protein